MWLMKSCKIAFIDSFKLKSTRNEQKNKRIMITALIESATDLHMNISRKWK